MMDEFVKTAAVQVVGAASGKASAAALSELEGAGKTPREVSDNPSTATPVENDVMIDKPANATRISIAGLVELLIRAGAKAEGFVNAVFNGSSDGADRSLEDLAAAPGCPKWSLSEDAAALIEALHEQPDFEVRLVGSIMEVVWAGVRNAMAVADGIRRSPPLETVLLACIHFKLWSMDAAVKAKVIATRIGCVENWKSRDAEERSKERLVQSPQVDQPVFVKQQPRSRSPRRPCHCQWQCRQMTRRRCPSQFRL